MVGSTWGGLWPFSARTRWTSGHIGVRGAVASAPCPRLRTGRIDADGVGAGVGGGVAGAVRLGAFGEESAGGDVLEVHLVRSGRVGVGGRFMAGAVLSAMNGFFLLLEDPASGGRLSAEPEPPVYAPLLPVELEILVGGLFEVCPVRVQVQCARSLSRAPPPTSPAPSSR